MALRILITERQRRLGSELRKLRQQAGLSVADGGKLIDMGGPHLSHIEAGRTAIPSPRLRDLVRAYHCTNEPYLDALVDMAESSGKGWWSSYRTSMPRTVLDLAEMESRATSLRGYETLVMPGLLQTEPYMRALMLAHKDATPEEIDTYVRFRMERQQVLTAPYPARLHVIIHEAALRMVVGNAHIMRGQLTHLLTTARLPNLTIQVLPFDSGPRAWISVPFATLTPGVAELETVAIEHPSARLNLDDHASLTLYGTAFENLRKSALAPVVTDHAPEAHTERDSCSLLQHLLYTYQGSAHA